jgi:hypothetical protein
VKITLLKMDQVLKAGVLSFNLFKGLNGGLILC